MTTNEATERRPVGMWGRAVRRLTSSNSEFHNQELADQARDSGCQTLAECRLRQLATLRGRIGSATLSPRGGRSWLEATVDDGTGTVTLVWMGRRSIPGIEAGRVIKVNGRLVKRGKKQVIYNPHYELLS